MEFVLDKLLSPAFCQVDHPFQFLYSVLVPSDLVPQILDVIHRQFQNRPLVDCLAAVLNAGAIDI